MLPKKRRLTSAEVREVIAHGSSLRGGVVSLKYVTNKGDFKVAMVASKSVAKRAVDRNRLRRALYRAFTTLPPEAITVLARAHTVFFVRNIPSPLIPALRNDMSAIINKISPTHV